MMKSKVQSLFSPSPSDPSDGEGAGGEAARDLAARCVPPLPIGWGEGRGDGLLFTRRGNDTMAPVTSVDCRVIAGALFRNYLFSPSPSDGEGEGGEAARDLAATCVLPLPIGWGGGEGLLFTR